MSQTLLLLLATATTSLLLVATGTVVAGRQELRRECLRGFSGGRRTDRLLRRVPDSRMEGNDAITGLAGSDEAYGDEGDDAIDDTTNGYEAGTPGADAVNRGPGEYRVFFDEDEDVIASSCETTKPQ